MNESLLANMTGSEPIRRLVRRDGREADHARLSATYTYAM